MIHGLINTALQRFTTDTYGPDTWQRVVSQADLGFENFEAMLRYSDETTEQLLEQKCDVLSRPRDTVLEDIGTYLVSHPKVESLRRLLRFGGVSFVEFLHSLDDLHDRARLAVADLDMPQLELHEQGGGRFRLLCHAPHVGWGHVLVGVLRAMADDYGALVFLEHQGLVQGGEVIEITLIEAAFSKGRSFELGARTG